MSILALAIPLVRRLPVDGRERADEPAVQAADPDELYDRAAESDPEAVAALYDAHHHAVRAFATRLLGDVHAAEDLVHDVFIGLPKAMKRWRRNGELRTYLIGIAINHARHHARSARRRRNAMDRLQKLPEPDAPACPENELSRSELAKALRRSLDKLPMRQRVAFVLCEVEERTSVEAAAIVGVPQGTIRSRLHHAKAKLRASLEREGYR